MQAEALIDQSNNDKALALIANPIPFPFDELEARRLLDVAAANRSRPKVALPYIARARLKATERQLKLQIDYEEARVQFNENRALAEQEVLQVLKTATETGDDYDSAQASITLGFFLKEANHNNEALVMNERGFALANRLAAKRLQARALLNLGYLYAYYGRSEESVRSEEQAAALFNNMGDQKSRIPALGEWSHVLNMQGKAAQAIKQGEEAYDLAEKNRLPPGDLRRMASNLAMEFLDANKFDEAEKWNKLADSTNPHVMWNEARIALGRSQRDRFFELCREALAKGDAPALRWQVLRDMAQAYADVSDFQNAYSNYDAALEVFEQARSKAEDFEKVSLLPRLIGLYQAYVEALIRDNREHQALEIIESSRARVLADRFGESGRKRTALREQALNTVFLSFWLAPKRSFVWLTSSKGRRRFELPADEEIEDAVTDYLKQIETFHKNPLAPGYAGQSLLWDMLLKGAAPLIPQGSRVVLVPDGSLHRLNLETVVVPGLHPHYWLEDVELVIAPSLALAPLFSGARSAKPGGANPKMLLIGAPDYSGEGFSALKFADKELDDIRVKFPNPHPQVFRGSGATPAAYLSWRPNRFEIIHFAAHAVAQRENPLQSAVILSRSGSDYRLYANDIYKTQIQANLVTVDACESAGTTAYAGEGLIGFAWVFLAAGARNVIAGTWDVDDASSPEMMSDLYGGIAAGLDPVSALHKAKLKLMRDEPKPYYWAPLQVYAASK